MAANILIVDDHEIVRRGLRSLLASRPDWQICGEAIDGVQGVEKAKALRPALVLMDISMPRMNGLEATRIIRKELPETSVVIISQNDPEVARLQAQEVDAAAYVAKGDLSRDLLPTISKLLGDGNAPNTARPAACECILARLASRWRHADPPHPGIRLVPHATRTDRQLAAKPQNLREPHPQLPAPHVAGMGSGRHFPL